MPTLFALFAIVVVPILFFMMTWFVVTACKIFMPSNLPTQKPDPGQRRRRATREGYSVPVGAREIREDQRFLSNRLNDATYHYEHGDSEGLPLTWFEELVNRRN